MLNIETILEIEEAAFDSWPALEVAQVDGWRLRGARGVTGRGNSVCAIRSDGEIAPAERIEAAECFYRAHELPPRFQINAAVQPANLDDQLAQRGYRCYSPTFVQTASLATILERTPALRLAPHFAVEVSEDFDEAWFALYVQSEQMDTRTLAVREAILRRIASPVAFAQLDVDGVPAAVGLGVARGRWMGIFCMSTRAEFRRQGAALALLRTLAIWGGMVDATDAYLQVQAHNAGAQSVYARAGFSTAYPYHYRILGTA